MNEIIKESINPKTGKKIIYNDEWHTYTVEGRRLVSSTTFIKKFFPKFDSDKWSKIIAKREGCSVEEILKKWKDKADSSSEYGTGVHEYMESLLKNESPKRTRNKRVNAVKSIVEESISKLLEEWEPIGIEKIVFNEEVAGTFDVLLRNRNNKNQYILGDWKTNEEIKQINKYNSFGFKPIEHIPDINYYHYALQLSLYKFLLLEEGYLSRDSEIKLSLYHIKPYNIELYEMPYLEKEIRSLLSIYKS